MVNISKCPIDSVITGTFSDQGIDVEGSDDLRNGLSLKLLGETCNQTKKEWKQFFHMSILGISVGRYENSLFQGTPI